MKFYMTSFYRRLFATIDFPPENGKQCLTYMVSIHAPIQVQAWSFTCLEQYLTIKSITALTMERIPIASAHTEIVLLEEFFPVTHKRGKCRLGGIKGTQSELNLGVSTGDLSDGRST